MFAHFRGFHTRSWFDELNPPRIALAFETVGQLRRMQDLLCTWPLKVKDKIVVFERAKGIIRPARIHNHEAIKVSTNKHLFCNARELSLQVNLEFQGIMKASLIIEKIASRPTSGPICRLILICVPRHDTKF